MHDVTTFTKSLSSFSTILTLAIYHYRSCFFFSIFQYDAETHIKRLERILSKNQCVLASLSIGQTDLGSILQKHQEQSPQEIPPENEKIEKRQDIELFFGL